MIKTYNVLLRHKGVSGAIQPWLKSTLASCSDQAKVRCAHKMEVTLNKGRK